MRRRARAALGVSFAVLVVWLVFVTAAGHWGRVGDHWAAALTMVFGSFVAGSTPQGGGAVAFPVFTKLLDIETAVARSFSLCIQTIGMVSASLSIIINRRAVEWKAVAVAGPVAIAAFLASSYLLGLPDEPFWPSRLPSAYVKVTFTLIVAAMAVVIWIGYRSQIVERIHAFPFSGPRVWAGLVVAAVLGGVASSLTGSGADVLAYVMVVVIVGVTPRIGVPTSVLVMACVSVAGFVLYGIVDGQLNTLLEDGNVVAVGGASVGVGEGGDVVYGAGGVDASRYDLYGMWLAAAPVVAFGAPLGAWASSLASDRQLVRVIIALAATETISTVVFLDGLIVNPDPALIGFALIGGLVTVLGLALLRKHRRLILGLPAVDTDQSFTRDRLDTGPSFRDQLAETDPAAEQDTP